MTTDKSSSRPGTASAIARSFDIYYRDLERVRRMDALHAALMPPGGLAFDIGAHVGDRTASFLRRGSAVVALEPDPHVFRALRLLYGRAPGVTLVRAAAGAEAGVASMYLNRSNPTVSTLSRRLVDASPNDPAWQDQVWDDRSSVRVVTLDGLIATHGRPDFAKIDVEGFEAKVLHGLSTPLPLLSFEVTMLCREVAYACLDRLSDLGRYVYNLSLGEEHRLRFPDWQDEQALRAEISRLPMSANSGDVYARLR
ncbi:MAG: FkbM family methyltransferase [Pseudomonadota bacterium]